MKAEKKSGNNEPNSRFFWQLKALKPVDEKGHIAHQTFLNSLSTLSIELTASTNIHQRSQCSSRTAPICSVRISDTTQMAQLLPQLIKMKIKNQLLIIQTLQNINDIEEMYIGKFLTDYSIILVETHLTLSLSKRNHSSFSHSSFSPGSLGLLLNK